MVSGLDAAKLLLKLKCSTIVLACRSFEKGEAAKKDILSSAAPSSPTKKSEILVFPIDMSSFTSVAAFADKCKSLSRIDAAILNAGVDMTEFSLAEGYEMTLTVNVISTFLLATLLLPLMRESAEKYGIMPRLAVVGSAVHFWTDPKALTTPPRGEVFKTLSVEKTTKMGDRYYLSKLPVMLLVRYLGKRLEESAKGGSGKPLVVLNNVAPGFCQTALFRNDATAGMAARVIGRSSEHGARTLVHGAVAGKESNAQYLSECRVKKASAFVNSKEGSQTGERLWEELRGLYEGVRQGCTEVW